MTTFLQLNHGWNAEPNAPDPQLSIVGGDLLLAFELNHQQFPEFNEDDHGVLRFYGCSRYRLGPTNDEGWYMGQCRFSKLAPDWGEFYEVSGDLRLKKCPKDWIEVAPPTESQHHYLFYFRDETFECDALDWELVVNGRLRACSND